MSAFFKDSDDYARAVHEQNERTIRDHMRRTFSWRPHIDAWEKAWVAANNPHPGPQFAGIRATPVSDPDGTVVHTITTL